MRIIDIETNQLAVIISGLVSEGLTFDCIPAGDGLWTIILKGGY